MNKFESHPWLLIAETAAWRHWQLRWHCCIVNSDMTPNLEDIAANDLWLTLCVTSVTEVTHSVSHRSLAAISSSDRVVKQTIVFDLFCWTVTDSIRYDTILCYLTCSKKMTDRQQLYIGVSCVDIIMDIILDIIWMWQQNQRCNFLIVYRVVSNIGKKYCNNNSNTWWNKRSK